MALLLQLLLFEWLLMLLRWLLLQLLLFECLLLLLRWLLLQLLLFARLLLLLHWRLLQLLLCMDEQLMLLLLFEWLLHWLLLQLLLCMDEQLMLRLLFEWLLLQPFLCFDLLGRCCRGHQLFMLGPLATTGWFSCNSCPGRLGFRFSGQHGRLAAVKGRLDNNSSKSKGQHGRCGQNIHILWLCSRHMEVVPEREENIPHVQSGR